MLCDLQRTHIGSDLLGSKAFAPVQSDIKGNIEVRISSPVSSHLQCADIWCLQKVRARYNAAPSQSTTLELLVANEKGEKKRTATEGLMWLLRGLSFTCKALQNSQADKNLELKDAFKSAYAVTLSKYHSFIIRPVFNVCFLTTLNLQNQGLMVF